ncbi:hypothetical protein ACPA0F_07295 [Solibacillus silvestris]
MKIRLLKDGYKKDELLYAAFQAGEVVDEDFYLDEYVEIKNAPDFPIYMGKGSEAQKKQDFLEAFHVMEESYVQLDRDIHFSEKFWHSLFVTIKRDYIVTHYPQVMESYREFTNIVLKTFDWENYVYKCILAVEYVSDAQELSFSKEKYYELIVENLDIFNYIIKYAIFRNGDFLVKILTIIHELGVSEILKAKITDRPDLGKDERYGRRVIFELNKAYPVLMSPLLDNEALQEEFLKALSNYYDVSTIESNKVAL